jgi:hypothetical protein
MAFSHGQILFFCAIGLVLLARPAAAFGAGNIASISKVEGINWRHGDIEDTLLTLAAAKAMSGKKFGKLDVKRVCRPVCISDRMLMSTRSISETGCETIHRLSMSAPSRTSAPRPFVSCSGFLVSYPLVMAPASSKLLPSDWAAIAPRNTSTTPRTTPTTSMHVNMTAGSVDPSTNAGNSASILKLV